MNHPGIQQLLLIEDDPEVAQLLREVLEAEGLHDAEVTIADSMSAAEKVLAEQSFDLILLDLGLPDADGVEAVQRVHAAAPRVLLVVLTGHDDEALALRALQEGAEDYLVKGKVDAQGLLRALRHAFERKVREDALFREKERAQVSLKCIGDAVLCTDLAGEITFLNLVGEQTTGWSHQEALGRPRGDVLRLLDGRGEEISGDAMPSAEDLDQTMHLPPSWKLIRRDGLEIPIEGSAAPIHDHEGNSNGAVIVFRDVSAAREIARQMAHSAEHDFLTGLPNRILLNDRVGQAIALAPRHGNKVVLLFLDVDGFKYINDSLGHSIGDKLLKSISERLVACVRESDTVSRQGGDEFVVLLSEVDRWEHAEATARRMLQAVAAPHSIDNHELHVSASIGVSVYPDDGVDAETLIKNADTAMYQAKAHGRQSYKFFKPAMYFRAVERQSIEEGLRRALERKELTLHYQPKVDLNTGRVTGAEALLRWTHPLRGPVPPSEFIHVAEDSGLVRPIGRWVLREACRQAVEWSRAGFPATTVAVNISALEFGAEGFLEEVL
ncbi:MAG: diguanylate cyclase, partial [Thermoanaerobaculia bacterium]